MSIFTPDNYKCEWCPTQISEGRRCKKCSEERDGHGMPFIIYCEVWHFQRKPGHQQSVWVHDNLVVNTSLQYKSWIGKHVSAFQPYLEHQGYDIIDMVPMLGEINADFFIRMKNEDDAD
jgi:hypothetical protein